MRLEKNNKKKNKHSRSHGVQQQGHLPRAKGVLTRAH